MAGKTLEFAIKINALLSEQFGAALKNVQNAMKNLQGTSKIMTGNASARMAQLQGEYAALAKSALLMRQYRNAQESLSQKSADVAQARLKSAQLTQEWQNQIKQTQEMERAYARLKAVYKENKSAMSADERTNFQEQIQAAKLELSAQKAREKESAKAASSGSRKAENLSAQLNQQRAALSQLQASMSAAGASVSELAAQEARLQNAINQTTAQIERQAQVDMRRQRFDNASQNMANAYGNFQNSIDTARTIMSPFKSALDEAVSYEQSMSKLKALTQTKNIRAGDFETVNREMASMDKVIKHLGATTEFTTNEVAQAAQKFAMSGWGSQQINDALKPVIDITTATGNRDVVKIADYLTDEMQALGLTDKNKFSQKQIAANMKSYGDAFAYALTQSNNDADSFHEAMKYMAPVGTQAGMSVSEQVAMAMTMADSGIKGSMGGTAGRMGILRLIAPPKAAVKAMESMGLMASDAQKAVAEAGAEMEKLGISADDSIGTRIQKLKKSFEGMDEKEVAAKLSKITGVNAVSGWGALLKDLDKFNERVAEMDSGATAGWAETVAGTMRDNTATQFELFNSAVSAAAVSLGNLFLPVVRQATQMITSFAEGLNNFIQKNPQMAAGIAGVAAGLSSLIVASAGAKLAMSGWEFVSSGMAVLKDSVVSVATTLATLPARISGAFAAMRAMSFASIFAGIGPAILPAIAIAAALAAAAYFVITNWSTVAPIFSQIGATISSALSTAFDALAPAISNVISAVSTLATAFAPVLGVLGAGIGAELLTVINLVANVAATLISTFANAIATVLNLFAGLGSAIGNLLQGNFSKAGEILVQTFQSVIEGIKSTIGSLFDGIGQTFSTFLDPINSLLGAKISAPSGGGSFGEPAANSVQAQTVQVQAATVEQPQNQEIFAGVNEQISGLLSSFSQIGEMQNAQIANQQMAQETAAQSAQIQTEAMTQLQTQMQTVGESFTQINTGVTTFNSELTNTGSQLQAANAGVTSFTAALTGTNGAITGFTGALTGSVGAVTGLGSAASGASGSISGLGSAASAACAALAAAGANAAAAVSAAAASIPTAKVAANYRGGIYPKGEFMTTFAEKSAEAAIPLDNSNRAINLWKMAGQILGVYPKNEKISVPNEPPKFDKLGNIEGLNGLADNLITELDDIQVARAKKEAQLKEYNAKMSKVVSAKNTQKSSSIFENIGSIFGDFLPATAPEFNPTSRSQPLQIPQIFGDFSTATAPEFNPISRSQPVQIPQIFDRLSDKIGIGHDSNINGIFSGIIDNIGGGIGNILGGITDNIGGGIGGIFENIFSGNDGGSLNTDNIFSNSQSSPIDLHFEINIAGNATAEDVKNGITAAIPTLEDFAEQYLNFQHENQRKSFA